MQVKTVQYGLGERGPKSVVTGELVCGDETLPEEEMAQNRCDFGEEIRAHPLDDTYHRERSAAWDKITAPLLTAANWGGQGLHLRGNFEGYDRSASKNKWLEAHGLEHWTEFYTAYGVELQKRFFGHFLKGEDTGWANRSKVQLLVRYLDRFEKRDEDDWPIPRTRWTKFHLNAETMRLSEDPSGSGHAASFDAMGDGLTFLSDPLPSEIEITGPSAVKLSVSSSTTDADLFVVLRVFDGDDNEVTFQGAIDPHTPIGQGWLRASHRKLDPDLSEPWRPYHSHDEQMPLTLDEPVDLDIEIWPTSLVVPAGYRIGLTVRGKDYEHAHTSGERLSNFKNELKGCGPFLHDDPGDRPAEILGGETTLHVGGGNDAYILLPIIPSKTS